VHVARQAVDGVDDILRELRARVQLVRHALRQRLGGHVARHEEPDEALGQRLAVSVLGAFLTWTMLAAEVPFAASGDGTMPKFFGSQNAGIAIIFVWTPPHFWALALLTHADYTRAKVPMYPVVHGEPATRLAIMRYMVLLLPLTLLGGLVLGILTIVLIFFGLASHLFH
jgi:hypothetical protein